MIGLALDSAKLFFTGRLFQNYGKVIRQMVIVCCLAIFAMVGAAQVLPIWAAAIIGGGVAGALQPYFFKDLKYA